METTISIIIIALLSMLVRECVSVCTDPTYYYNAHLGYCILCPFACL